MLPGERVHITPKTVHRMTAIEDSDIFEVSTPELHDVVGWKIGTAGRQGSSDENGRIVRGRSHDAFTNRFRRECRRR
jgi:hypothetical protein